MSRLEENEHASNEVFAQDVVLDVEGVVFDAEGQQLEDDGQQLSDLVVICNTKAVSMTLKITHVLVKTQS